MMTPDAIGPLTPAGRHAPHAGQGQRGARRCHRARNARRSPATSSCRRSAALTGDYVLDKTAKGDPCRAAIVQADITQICVVTLEPFDSTVDEEVEVDFAEPEGMPAEHLRPTMHDYEPPDEIVNGQIDLGALTAEFLALGLDPYPRKPGVAFEVGDGDRDESPFAALAKLKEQGRRVGPARPRWGIRPPRLLRRSAGASSEPASLEQSGCAPRLKPVFSRACPHRITERTASTCPSQCEFRSTPWAATMGRPWSFPGAALALERHPDIALPDVRRRGADRAAAGRAARSSRP